MAMLGRVRPRTGSRDGRAGRRRLILPAIVGALALSSGLVAPAAGEIVDGTSPGGRTGFYFLPPMVPDPGITGNFDAALTPEADVCVLDADRTACTPTTIASFDTGGQGPDVITVDVAGESYSALWFTPSNLAVSNADTGNTRYRLEVFQVVHRPATFSHAPGDTERVRLGYADLWVVSKARDLKGMPAGFVGVVRGSPFTIKFRIQTTTVGLVTVTPDPASIPLGQTQGFDAAVLDLHGNPMPGRDVAWTTDPTGIASLSPTASTTDGAGTAATTATGTALGTTAVIAATGGVSGSASVEVFSPQPALVDDAYTATIGGADLAANVTGNDFMGVPAGTVTSFGGGTLGGAATDHPAGSSVALAGGILTVTADGALTLAAPTTAGVYTFDYRVTNPAGFDDATVTITVQRVPVAEDDAIGALPGAALSADLFADNGSGADDRGFPQGDVASFGGGSLGGSVDDHDAGNSATLGTDGSVSVAADGTLSGTAPTATGTYTLDYRLTSAAGSDTATVTITIQRPPVAHDDAFTTTAGTPVGGNLLADNGSGADDPGEPAGAVASFGGGSLPGDATTNTAPATVSLAGGSLTVNADGTFSFDPTVGGDYTFDYRLTNPAGHDDATVTITVNQAPTAAGDAPTPTSAPGDAWHTALDTTLDSTTHTTPSVLDNDTLGFPQATLTHFGGGDLGGAVTDTVAGDTATADGHSLTVGADGQLSYTPKSGFTGPFTFIYRIANAGGTSDATVTVAVGERPVAAADAYPHTLVGNVGIDTATGSPFSVLGNDQGDALTATVGAPSNGEVTLNPDGTFTFDPAAGFRSGNGTFTYTVGNGFGISAPATVTIPVGSQVIWFVDNGAPACTTLAAGCGRLSHPLSSLAAFDTLNTGAGSNPADNHHVFVYESTTAYTGPVTLRDGQRLIGQDATSPLATLTGVTLPPHSPALPAMASGNTTTTTITSAGNGVSLGAGNRLHGLRLGAATGTALTGTGFGTLVVSDVAIDTAGRALDLENGTAGSPFAFTSVSSSGGANNIRLAAGGGVLAGSFSLGSGSLSGSTAEAFLVNGGTATVTYGGTITNAANRSVSVSNTSGGAVTLSGAVTDTGSGIQLTSNPGATIGFTGPLAITTPGTAFAATGGGTVRVTATTNTLTATATGPALRIQDTTIHSDGVTFQRISSTGGTNGIVLTSTGTAGGLSVSGTGTAGSGGTIQNATGDGIVLSSTRSVELDRMIVHNNDGSGINGDTVTNFTLANSTVSDNGDDVAVDEAGIRFTNLEGTAALTNTTVFGSIEDNVRVLNTSGSLTLAVTGSTIRDTNPGPGGNTGLSVQANGTATITADVAGSSFLRNRTEGIQVVTNGAGTIDVDLGTTTPNTYNDNNIGVNIAHNSSGTLTFDVAGSTFSAPTKTDAASPVNLNLGFLGATMSGTVSNNTISNNDSMTGPGMRVISNGTGTMTVAITGNTISQVANHGIETLARDGSSTVNATYAGNTITLTAAGALDGMRVSSGALETDTTTVCADLVSNTVSTIAGQNDIRVRNRFAGTTFRLESYAGSPTDMAAVVAYLVGRNTITTAAADHDAANGGFLNSVACPTP